MSFSIRMKFDAIGLIRNIYCVHHSRSLELPVCSLYYLYLRQNQPYLSFSIDKTFCDLGWMGKKHKNECHVENLEMYTSRGLWKGNTKKTKSECLKRVMSVHCVLDAALDITCINDTHYSYTKKYTVFLI